MDYQTKVKLFLEDAPTEWISCAIVYLYDRDVISADDHLGMGITNVYGEATFRFTADEFVDLDDRVGGTLPELYVKVFDGAGACVLLTRAESAANAVPDLIRVPIAREIAVRHNLI